LEWIEVFVETSKEGLELVSGLLYQCGLTGLMIEDGSDFQAFLENPDRDWDYIEDELVEEKAKQPTGITFFVRDNIQGREQLSDIKGSLLSLKASEKEFELGSLEVTIKNIKEDAGAETVNHQTGFLGSGIDVIRGLVDQPLDFFRTIADGNA